MLGHLLALILAAEPAARAAVEPALGDWPAWLTFVLAAG